MSEKPREPDEFSNAWYRQQFKGFQHLLNRQANDYADLSESMQAVLKRLSATEAALERARAVVGEMRDQYERLARRMDRHEVDPGDEGSA